MANNIHPSPAATTAFIFLLFFCVLGGVHQLVPAAHPQSALKNYWGTASNVFDGSELNAILVPWVTEAWSASTDLPFAGVHLLRVGLANSYDLRLIFVYTMIIAMYSVACVGHITLFIPICQIAIVLVISVPISTFMFWGGLMGDAFKSPWLRAVVCAVGWAILVCGIFTLPFILSPLGGLFTVFCVQTPPIVLALGGAVMIHYKYDTGSEVLEQGVRCLMTAGILLVLAMISLLGEVHICGKDNCSIVAMWGFPWVHQIVHALQQIAVYLFGVGTACVHYTLFEDRPCKLYWWCGIAPYLNLSKKPLKECQQ